MPEARGRNYCGDIGSTSVKPASPGLPDDEGVNCYQARKWAGSAKQEAG
jgi:hypothetical protein